MNPGVVCGWMPVLGSADGPIAVFLAGELGFSWNWINVFGLVTVVLLLIPNLVFAWRRKGAGSQSRNRCLNLCEQIGRYGSMIFLVFCIWRDGFGFPSVISLLLYLFGNGILLVAYWTAWGIYFWMTHTGVWTGTWISKSQGPTAVFIAGKPKVMKAVGVQMALAVILSLLFLLDGLVLRYIPLLVCGILFAVAHIYITWENCRMK